jgi:hypothetical protein
MQVMIPVEEAQVALLLKVRYCLVSLSTNLVSFRRH